VASVSAREPASIQIPTVAVCRYGEYSVATERPFDRVVVCVGRMSEFAGVASVRCSGIFGFRRCGRRSEVERLESEEGTSSLEADMAGGPERKSRGNCLQGMEKEMRLGSGLDFLDGCLFGKRRLT
jgi:hypothetical protein